MKKFFVAAALSAASLPFAAPAQFEQFKGKLKPGLYEYKMTMEMPNMPNMPNMPKGAPGMRAPMTHQQCVTAEDVEKGGMGDRNKVPKDCQVKDFKMSGNTATYKTECGGEMNVKAETKVAFNDTGMVIDSSSTMVRKGQPMTTKLHMESKYLGACK